MTTRKSNRGPLSGLALISVAVAALIAAELAPAPAAPRTVLLATCYSPEGLPLFSAQFFGAEEDQIGDVLAPHCEALDIDPA